MRTYISRKEHESAGDYSGPVLIRGHFYRVIESPVFEELRDTASIEAVLLSNHTTDDGNQTSSE